MKLNDLLKDVEYEKIKGNRDIDIENLFYDSRTVTENSLFFCITGFKLDGHEFAAQAVHNGAAAIVVEHFVNVPDNICQIMVKDSRKAMSLISANFYGNPSKKLHMIGVTGTNGKTTTTYLIKSIAETIGKKVGLIGTIANMIGDQVLTSKRTTPESMDLQKLLNDMAEQKCEWVVMEVSSHSLDLERVAGINFDVGIFTNLTQDHLDYHKTFENYKNAKKKLFYNSKYAAVNTDDDTSEFMVQDIDNLKVVKYGVLNGEKSDVSASNIYMNEKGVNYTLNIPDNSIEINFHIPGMFSVYNSLAAAAACYIMGVPIEGIKSGLESVKGVPGRFEVLPTKTEYSVILDYAHTPDGLEKILKTVAEFAKGRIITLFGCGGDRDKGKRPIMGEIAGNYSDFCIVTSDNPRTEDPLSIIKQVEEGVKKTKCNYICIENRKEAIRYALENGKENDVIVLAGKGHENYQILKDSTIHFDEREIVAEILKQDVE